MDRLQATQVWRWAVSAVLAALVMPGVGELEAAAASDPDRQIVVSIEKRMLYLVEDGDTVLAAPVALGKTGTFTYEGRTYRWRTPPGTRRVLAKKDAPIWTPPDWHYYEKAVNQGLEPVKMKEGERYELSDGTYLEIRDGQVGRVNQFGNWWAWTPGMEIVFDGKIFVPPIGTPQRSVPDALGPYALSLGDGYLIHGTNPYNKDSIGTYASHGCIRMHNDDVRRLFERVEVGTRVIILE